MSFLWHTSDNSLILNNDSVMSNKTGAFIKIISIKSEIETVPLLNSHSREDWMIFSDLNTLNNLESLIKPVN